MKRFIAALIFLTTFGIAGVSAQSGTTVTGTFLTQEKRTPAQASLDQLSTVATIPIYGYADFVAVDTSGNHPREITCGGFTFAPQNVRGWIKSDGTLMNSAGAAGVVLIPTSDCAPSGLAYQLTLTLAGSAANHLPSVTFKQLKPVPDISSVDWSSLSPATVQSPAFAYQLQQGGTIVDFEDFTGIAAPANPASGKARVYFNSGTLRFSCVTTAGADCAPAGSGGGASVTVNGSALSNPSAANLQDSATIAFTNPSAGNIQAVVKSASVTDTMLANAYSGVGSGSAHQFVSALARNAAPIFAQPGFSDLSGNPTAAQLGTGTPTAAKFLHGDLSWAALLAADIPSLDASKIATGTFSAALLPNPSATTLGGIESLASVSHRWINAISTLGVPSATQPDYSDLTGTPTLPANTTSTASQFFTAYNSSTGAFTKAQPAFTDISGLVAAGQLPNPSATTLGGIESLASASHRWINAISTLGVPSATQPDYSDLTGTPTLPANTTSTASQFFTAYNSSTGAFTKAQPAFTDISGTLAAGQLPPIDVAHNGTGAATFTAHGVLLGEGTSPFGVTAAGGAATVLMGAASADPSFVAVTTCGDATHAIGFNGSAWTCQNITASAGSVTLDAIVAAGAGNTINSGDNAQVWNWKVTTASKSAFTFGENVASTATGTPYLINIQTLATSTANPLVVTAAGTTNGIQVLKSGFLSSKGAGGIDSGMLHCDVSTSTKCVQFGLTNISTSTTRTLNIPDANSTTAQSISSVSHNFLTAMSAQGVFSQAQPAFTDISGSVAAGQLPNPSASTLGGIESLASTSHQWINAISTSGVPSSTQPAFTDISGTISSGQLPTITLDIIAAAAGASTINNADNAIVWNWKVTTASKSAFTFGENVASTATGTPYLINIQTLATSTANPLVVTAVGTANGIQVLKSGFLSSKGTGGIDSGMLHCDATTSTKCMTFTLSNITAANTRAVNIPDASSTTAQSISSVSHQFLTAMSAQGVFSQAQPAFTDISGTLSATQLPNPTASTLGGIESLASVSHKWINTISTSGVPSATQPDLTDLTGTTNLVTAGSTGTTKQICTVTSSNRDCTWIDYPDVKEVASANCNNANPGAGWSIGASGVVACRAGTNNIGGYISITDTSSSFAQFAISIPEDWDSGSLPFIRVKVASTDTSSGHTIIPQIKVSCAKGDGSTTDDVSFNAAHSLSTVTLNTTANQFWSTANVQMNSTDMTGCVAGSVMTVQIGRATDTATNANFYSATITFPRLLVVQGN